MLYSVVFVVVSKYGGEACGNLHEGVSRAVCGLSRPLLSISVVMSVMLKVLGEEMQVKSFDAGRISVHN